MTKRKLPKKYTRDTENNNNEFDFDSLNTDSDI